MFDDFPYIVQNSHIKAFLPKQIFFLHTRWISLFLNQLTYKFWGLTIFGYRIINLSIHITSGILVFIIVHTLLKNLKRNNFLKNNSFLLATITCALYLLHPVQTQTVVYITQMRLEGLVNLFSFLTILSFIFAFKTKNFAIKALLYALTTILISFSAGTKEIVIVLPVLIILVDWFFLAEGKFSSFKKRILIHFLLIAIMLMTFSKLKYHPIKKTITLSTTQMQNNRGNALTYKKPKAPITPNKFFISQFKVILHYINMYFYPLHISFDYDFFLSEKFTDKDVLIPLAILLLILFSALFMFIRNQANIFTFSVLWFFVAVLPRASIIPSTELVCDYKTHLASFGILFLIAFLILKLINKISEMFFLQKQHKIFQQAALGLIALTLGFTSYSRNLVWKTDLAYWADTVKSAPRKARGFNNYAVALMNTGQPKLAVENYLKAIECEPTYGEPQVNLAIHYQRTGDRKKANERYQLALKSGEGHPELFNNLGMFYLEDKKFDKAETAFKKALELYAFYGRGVYSRAMINMGRVYHLQNKLKQAIEYYEIAFKEDNFAHHFHYLHGLAAFQAQLHDKAISSLERVQRTQKNYQNTSHMLASCYYQKQDYKNASKNFGFHYEQNKNDISRAYNYAQALLNLKEYETALPLFEQCKTNEHQYPFAQLHTAKCLKGLGKIDLAKKELISIVQTTKNNNIKQMGINELKAWNAVKTI